MSFTIATHLGASKVTSYSVTTLFIMYMDYIISLELCDVIVNRPMILHAPLRMHIKSQANHLFFTHMQAQHVT